MTQNYRNDYPGPQDPRQYNSPFQQQDHPGHRPAYTTPHFPAADGFSLPTAYDHQHVLASTVSARTEPVITGPASTEAASAETTKKPRQRKRERRGNQREGEEEGNRQKETKKKNKGDKGVITKGRKEQEKKDRKTLSRTRDEAAARALEMASRNIPDDEARTAFEQQWESVMGLNREIDDKTEKYIFWCSTRSNLRKTDRAVPERKQKD